MKLRVVLSQKRVESPLWLRDEFPTQVEEFKHLRVLFTSQERMEWKTDKQIYMAYSDAETKVVDLSF